MMLKPFNLERAIAGDKVVTDENREFKFSFEEHEVIYGHVKHPSAGWIGVPVPPSRLFMAPQ